ncbi:hypothetical protein [Microbacterium sp.]|uniref:hypothetical protein n=1 Tax=Microbacterium sp. TaxID=51671 RepID=UPI0039E6F92D
MVTDAERMLAGTRGRRLCLEYVRLSDPALSEAVFWLGYRAAPQNSTIFAIGGSVDDALAEGRTHSPERLAAGIRSLDLSTARAERIREALRTAVDTARYWQEPDGDDLVAYHPEVRHALGPVSEVVLAAPAAAGWRSSCAPNQWAVDWRDPDVPAREPSGSAATLAHWRTAVRDEEERAARERPADVRARWSGTWWSRPLGLLQSRGAILDALELVEDSSGWERAVVTPVRGIGRVYEIHGPEDWARLCRQYPVEVTASRRHDWFRITGWEGRWLIPDWLRIAEEWDAVHLSTFGYLTAAATLIPIDGEYASVIGGWAPDLTIRLRDGAFQVLPAEASEWTLDDGAWGSALTR